MKYKIPKLEDIIESNIDEAFYNPFVEDDDNKPKKTEMFADKGGFMRLRKESFNINRIEFTKRPNGEYTLLSKTTFAKGEIIEICPILTLGVECKAINKLKDIVFELDKNKEEFALVFGYGSMYRHSAEANVEYAFNRGAKQMYFLAKRFIKVGEELTINYGQDYWEERNSLNLMAKNQEEAVGDISNNPLLNATETNESGIIQPSMSDIQNTDEVNKLSSPVNQNNPVKTGVPIIGSGQS